MMALDDCAFLKLELAGREAELSLSIVAFVSSLSYLSNLRLTSLWPDSKEVKLASFILS